MAQVVQIIEADFEEIDREGADDQQERLRDALAGFVSELEREAERRVGRRVSLEKRWLEDLRQYHGVYEPEIIKELKAQSKSELFINVTRPKTNTAEARLSDMLFPTDDKNWGIKPTPVPQLAREAERAATQAKGLEGQANELLGQAEQAEAAGQAPQAQALRAQADALAQQGGDIGSKLAESRAVMEEAQARAEAMEDEIEDQLRECRYNVHARDAIRDACMLGTGIIKGPVMLEEPKREWRTVTGKGGKTFQVLETVQERKPGFIRVDPWALFPDPDARTEQDSDDWYERQLMTQKQLRRLSRMPGIDRAAVRQLLQENPRQSTPYYMAEMRSITGLTDVSAAQCYHVWHYYGSITSEQLMSIAGALGKDDMARAYQEADPLDEVHVRLIFCQGHLLLFSEHPMDSGESVYSFFRYEKDDGSIWGYGVPYKMRDSQSALNAAWRMMMDNAGLSTGPQILINNSMIEPADGDWTLKPRKIWYVVKQRMAGEPDIFETFEINSHQAELMAIVELVRRMIDDETGISQIAQGEQGPTVTKTAQGMAILMNSSNVVFRRIVKNYDDDLTVPTIRRAYHWNMQFPSRPEIVGDYEIDARGSSVLMVREMQSQNLAALVTTWTVHPVLGPLVRAPEAARKAVQGMMIAADDVLKTDEEIEQEAAEAANAPPQPTPEMQLAQIEADTKMKLAEMDGKIKVQVAEINRETTMMKLAEAHNMQLDELEARLNIKRMEVDGKERGLAVELASRERTGMSAGGAI